jgi:hypothetical protein
LWLQTRKELFVFGTRERSAIFGYGTADAIGKSLDIIIPDAYESAIGMGIAASSRAVRAATARATFLRFPGSERTA